MELVGEVYKITRELPKSETFGLSSQMQRAAVSIPSAIAEGARRNHKTEYIQFLGIANGSAAELETQLILAQKIYKINGVDFKKVLDLTEEILKMLYSLIKSLSR